MIIVETSSTSLTAPLPCRVYPLTEGSLRLRRPSHLHLLFCPCLLSTMFYSEASDPSLMSVSFIIL